MFLFGESIFQILCFTYLFAIICENGSMAVLFTAVLVLPELHTVPAVQQILHK